MSVLGALEIGKRALGAASAGIEVTSQNVGNAATLGYSRKTLLSTASDPLDRGGLWVGQGVDLTGIRRATDRLLGMRIVEAAGAEGQATATLDSLRIAEAWFDESASTGLSEAWDDLFASISGLTTDPADPSLRRGVLDSAVTLATVVTRTADGLQGTLDNLDAGLDARIEDINAVLEEIASLNGSIGRNGAADGPSDLMDRRDQLVRDLAEATGATVDLAADGQATVFIGGHAVVSGNNARLLSVADGSDGVPVISVATGKGTIPVTAELRGELGGIREAREATARWLATLDSFAFDLASGFNAVHAAGFDANGTAGSAFFVAPASEAGAAAALSVEASLLADPDLLAAALTGAGDAGDGGNLAALLDFQSAAGFGAGTSTGLTFLSALTSDVGNTVAAAENASENETALLSDLDAARTSVSGVDTDEEAIRLIEYQAAYRAAAQVISAADELIGTLLAIGG